MSSHGYEGEKEEKKDEDSDDADPFDIRSRVLSLKLRNAESCPSSLLSFTLHSILKKHTQTLK